MIASSRTDAAVSEQTKQGDSTAEVQISISEMDKAFSTKKHTTQALEDINLDITSGELVALIGRSGCGKSTLLRVMGGLLPPTGGNVFIGGKPLWTGSTVDTSVIERLGVVFQEPNLFPWFDVLDNIALPLKLRGMVKAERRERAAELAELVGLQDFTEAYPRELSGGMKQRVAIARALSRDPELLLMDEPFGALDAMTREKMNLELQRIAAATGATVVFVTHDIAEAVFIGDRVVQLTPRPGRIESITEIAFERPRHMDIQTTPEFGTQVRTLRHALDGEL